MHFSGGNFPRCFLHNSAFIQRSSLIVSLDHDNIFVEETFFCVDEFFAKKNNDQYTSVNFETCKSRMDISDKRKFGMAKFEQFRLALNNKNDLVQCHSIALFELIPTEVRPFYEDEKSGLNRSREAAMDQKKVFENYYHCRYG